MNYKGTTLSIIFLFLFLITGCKKNDNPTDSNSSNTTTGNTTYAGTIANSKESGALTLNVANGKVNSGENTLGTVTGSIKLSTGTTISLNGTITNGTISVSGGGYTFSGIITNGKISGTYTGPNGTGAFSAQSSSNNSAKTYLGTYQDNDQTSHGYLNLTLNGNVITGLAVSATNSDMTYLAGTLSGTDITIQDAGHPADGTIANGKLSGSTISGTYGGEHPGTWTASEVSQ